MQNLTRTTGGEPTALHKQASLSDVIPGFTDTDPQTGRSTFRPIRSEEDVFKSSLFVGSLLKLPKYQRLASMLRARCDNPGPSGIVQFITGQEHTLQPLIMSIVLYAFPPSSKRVYGWEGYDQSSDYGMEKPSGYDLDLHDPWMLRGNEGTIMDQFRSLIDGRGLAWNLQEAEKAVRRSQAVLAQAAQEARSGPGATSEETFSRLLGYSIVGNDMALDSVLQSLQPIQAPPAGDLGLPPAEPARSPRRGQGQTNQPLDSEPEIRASENLIAILKRHLEFDPGNRFLQSQILRLQDRASRLKRGESPRSFGMELIYGGRSVSDRSGFLWHRPSASKIVDELEFRIENLVYDKDFRATVALQSQKEESKTLLDEEFWVTYGAEADSAANLLQQLAESPVPAVLRQDAANLAQVLRRDRADIVNLNQRIEEIEKQASRASLRAETKAALEEQLAELKTQCAAKLKKRYDYLLGISAGMKDQVQDKIVARRRPIEKMESLLVLWNAQDSELVRRTPSPGRGPDKFQFANNPTLNLFLGHKGERQKTILFITPVEISFPHFNTATIDMADYPVEADEAALLVDAYARIYGGMAEDANMAPEDLELGQALRRKMANLLTGKPQTRASEMMLSSFRQAMLELQSSTGDFDPAKQPEKGEADRKPSFAKSVMRKLRATHNDMSSSNAPGGIQGVVSREPTLRMRNYIRVNTSYFGTEVENWVTQFRAAVNAEHRVELAQQELRILQQQWDRLSAQDSKREEIGQQIASLKQATEADLKGGPTSIYQIPHFLILYGNPAAGKSVFADAFAEMTDYEFYSVQIQEQHSKWLGESEKNFKAFLDWLIKCRDTVFLFDEFDSQITTVGSAETQGHDTKRIGKLLEKLSDKHFIDEMLRNNIFFIATTNNIDRVRDALVSRAEGGAAVIKVPDPRDIGTFAQFLRDGIANLRGANTEMQLLQIDGWETTSEESWQAASKYWNEQNIDFEVVAEHFMSKMKAAEAMDIRGPDFRFLVAFIRACLYAQQAWNASYGTPEKDGQFRLYQKTLFQGVMPAQDVDERMKAASAREWARVQQATQAYQRRYPFDVQKMASGDLVIPHAPRLFGFPLNTNTVSRAVDLSVFRKDKGDVQIVEIGTESLKQTYGLTHKEGAQSIRQEELSLWEPGQKAPPKGAPSSGQSAPEEDAESLFEEPSGPPKAKQTEKESSTDYFFNALLRHGAVPGAKPDPGKKQVAPSSPPPSSNAAQTVTEHGQVALIDTSFQDRTYLRYRRPGESVFYRERKGKKSPQRET